MILVAGEALVDLVPDGDVLRAHPGGGPFNTARTIGRLAQPVAYLGRISSDRFGARQRALLEADGVGLGSVVATDDPTTLAIVEVDADGVARYRFYDRGTAAPGLTPGDALAALPAAMVHVGTLGLVFEPVASALEAVVEQAGDALVAVDPNIRPGAIPDERAYRDRLRRVLARADLVKLSEEDAAWLDPSRPPVEAARSLLGGGPAVALFTRGPAGAVVVTPDTEIAVPAPAARVADTIGAGDAFGGGFLAWWSEHALTRDDLVRTDAVVDATRFACIVAARTCERPGASPPYRAELPVTGARGPRAPRPRRGAPRSARRRGG